MIEREVERAQNSFSIVLDLLKRDQDERVQEIALSLSEKEEAGKVRISYDFNSSPQPITQCALMVDKVNPHEDGYRVVDNTFFSLLINVHRVFGSTLRVFASDLLRSAAVINQFPVFGYQRMLREVYSDAIGIQEEWLQNQRVSFRHSSSLEKEEFLRKLLGDAAYYTDMSFDHWRQAAADHRIPFSDQQELLERLARTPDYFIALRKLHARNLQFRQDHLAQLTVNDRAFLSAYWVIENYLKSGDQIDRNRDFGLN